MSLTTDAKSNDNINKNFLNSTNITIKTEKDNSAH